MLAGKHCIFGDVAAEDIIAHTTPRVPRLPADPLPGRLVIFGIVSVALLMASVDQTIVATALPTLQHDLGARVNWSSWTITAYSLGQVLVMPIAGKLGDQIGRKRVFVAAIVIFTVASLCCGLANDIYLLVVLRAVQAIGGGAFMPTSTGIVAEQFGRDRDRALGLFASIFPVGGVIGPVLGGIFVNYLSWRWIFLVNVPVGAILVLLALWFIPSRPRAIRQRLDFAGVALLGATLLPAMLGVTSLGSGGARILSVGFVLPVAIALVSAALFVRHAAVAEGAFIPLRFLGGHGFAVMNLINFLYGSAVMGFAALIPLYAQQRYGIGEFASGTLLTARAITMTAAALSAVVLLRRTGYRWPVVGGLLAVAAGLLLLAIPPRGLSAYSWLAFGAGVTGLGMGMCSPAANNATLRLAPEHAAAVAGLRGMFRQSGGITTVSVMAAVLARSTDPGLSQAHGFIVLALLLVLALPLMLRVPEHRGAW